jgi:F420-dependent methylenetetrahydromethanopterin dehydrogenase
MFDPYAKAKAMRAVKSAEKIKASWFERNRSAIIEALTGAVIIEILVKLL